MTLPGQNDQRLPSALAKGTEVFEKKSQSKTSNIKNEKITKYQPHIKMSARSEELKPHHKTIITLKTWKLYLSTKLN